MSSSSSTEHEIPRKNCRPRKGDVSLRARKALEIVKTMSPTLLASRVNYKKCKDGVAAFEALRPRVKPASGPISYSTLAGQQMAPLFAAASLDNVLSVLIEETAEARWRCDVILDFAILGSPEGEPRETREEAEQVALGVLSQLGAEFLPAGGYEPVDDADSTLQIRLGGQLFVVASIPEALVQKGLAIAMADFSCSEDLLCVGLAHLLLHGSGISAAEKAAGLTLLANCRWTHISQEVIDHFCVANSIDRSSVFFLQLIANLARAMTDVSQEAVGPSKDLRCELYPQWEQGAEKVLCNLLSKFASRSDATKAEIAALRYELAYLRESLSCSSDQSFPERDNGIQADDLSLILRNRALTEEEQSTIKILIASHLVCLEHLRAAGEAPRLPRRVALIWDDRQRQGAELRIFDNDLTDAEIADIWERNHESGFATFDHETPVAPTIH